MFLVSKTNTNVRSIAAAFSFPTTQKEHISVGNSW
jgi:hypothetical protein